MKARKLGLMIAVGLAAATTLRPSGLSAAPNQLSCVLASADESFAQAGLITVTFDDDAKTLQVQNGKRTYVFTRISISNVAISGDVDSTSIGIDRSSLGLVWQQYTAEKVTTEYGQCHSSFSPSTTH
jgi:hypothetical protein